MRIVKVLICTGYIVIIVTVTLKHNFISPCLRSRTPSLRTLSSNSNNIEEGSKFGEKPQLRLDLRLVGFPIGPREAPTLTKSEDLSTLISFPSSPGRSWFTGVGVSSATTMARDGAIEIRGSRPEAWTDGVGSDIATFEATFTGDCILRSEGDEDEAIGETNLGTIWELGFVGFWIGEYGDGKGVWDGNLLGLFPNIDMFLEK